MASFCIPKEQVQKLKDAALRKEVDVRELYKMSSAERRAFFEKFTDQKLGEFINTKFEQAIISKQKDAMLQWAEGVFSPRMKKKPVYQTVVDKIKSLDELGVLDPKTEKAFLEDLVADKLGVRVTPAEIQAIDGMARKIREAQEKLGEDLGVPGKANENLAFFEAKKVMDDYLQGLVPANRLRILTSTIGRGMLLLSVKSPVLNIGSNFEIGFAEALSRRVTNLQLRGADNALAVDYVKMVNRIYRKTGYDVSRMRSLTDTGASGERVIGEGGIVHSQGPGATRRAARIVDDIVYKNMLGAPDAAFASIHFADSVNLNARKAFPKNPQKATAAMEDAMRIDPKTPEGAILREQAILDAEVATWTNKTWASRFSLGIRNVINELTGDLRLGDFFLPFVKTPANVIATGFDYAGMGFPKAAVKTIAALRDGTLREPAVLRNISRDLVRAGLGLTGAVVMASQLSRNDFMGAYDPSRRQIEELRNSRENSIRIGGKWISVEWFGPLAVPITAIMYARKYGTDAKTRSFQFMLGGLSGARNLPGVNELADFFEQDIFGQQQTLEGVMADLGKYAVEEATARLTPSLSLDLAKATDPYERKSQGGADAFKARVPGLRQTLPIKENIFAEPVQGEPAWSDILFGARVKTDKDTAITRELTAVAEATDQSISFTDWQKSNAKTLAQFREKVGPDKFEEARKKYGQYLKGSLEALFRSGEYANLSPEDKLDLIREQDNKQMEKVFREYAFKYKPEKK